MTDAPRQGSDLGSSSDDDGSVTPPVDTDRQSDRPGREPGELIVALSPRQIIGGFAVLAGLIVMLQRRRRHRD